MVLSNWRGHLKTIFIVVVWCLDAAAQLSGKLLSVICSLTCISNYKSLAASGFSVRKVLVFCRSFVQSVLGVMQIKKPFEQGSETAELSTAIILTALLSCSDAHCCTGGWGLFEFVCSS